MRKLAEFFSNWGATISDLIILIAMIVGLVIIIELAILIPLTALGHIKVA